MKVKILFKRCYHNSYTTPDQIDTIDMDILLLTSEEVDKIQKKLNEEKNNPHIAQIVILAWSKFD